MIKSIRECLNILFLVLATLGVAYVSGADYPPDIDRIKKRGKIRVAMVADDQIPFFFKQNGEYRGTDIDLAKGIAGALNVNLEISRKAKSFNDLIPLVINNDVDIVISKLSRTLKRSQKALFSQPYFKFHQALAFNRVNLAKVADTDFQIKKYVKNFSGKLGVIKGSSYVTYAQVHFPNAEVIEYPSWEDVVVATVNGEVLAAYRDDFEIKKVLRVNPDFNLALKLVVIKDLPDHISMAFNWSAINLRDFVNTYISGVRLPEAEEIFLKFEDVLKQDKIILNNPR